MFAKALVVIALTLVAGTLPVSAQQRVIVGIGGKSSLGFLPVTIAERLGYFKNAGLSVELNDFPGGPQSVEALVGGSADIAVAAFEYPLLLQVKGINLISVAVMTKSYGNVLALRKPLAGTYKSPKDLKGLKIGVTSPGSAMAGVVQQVLAKDGLTLNDVSIIGIGSGGGAIAAVKSGRVDGISHVDPVVSRLVFDGDIVPIVDARTPAGMQYFFGGEMASSTILTSPAFVHKNPAAVQSFVTAVVRALDWMSKTPVEKIVDVVPSEYYAGTRQDYERIVAANMSIFTTDGIATKEAAETTLKFQVTTGKRGPASPEDLAKTYDNSYAEAADKQLAAQR
jgi:NitT/TauT family transport system substrate-binding protein